MKKTLSTFVLVSLYKPLISTCLQVSEKVSRKLQIYGKIIEK